MSIKKLGFLIKSIAILVVEYIKFLVTRNQMSMVQNIAQQLAKENIFYVKIFQSLSSNNEFFTDESTEFLTQYTDRAPYTSSEINTSFIKTIESIKETHPEHAIVLTNLQPIQSGMVSIVYEAMMKNDKKVIIKVLRKGIREKLKEAMEYMEYSIRFFATVPFFKHLNLLDIFMENKETMMEQLDFSHEVENIKDMYEKNKYIDYVVVPKVYEEYTELNNDMIVMDYIDGIKLSDVMDKDKDVYSYLLAKFGIKCVLFDRLYHGDLHQGNILFIKEKCDNNKDEHNETTHETTHDTNHDTTHDTYNHKLGIIDYGIIGRLTKEEQNNYYLFFKNFFHENYKDAALHIVNYLAEPKEKVEALEKEPEKRDALIKEIEIISEKACKEEKRFSIHEICGINEALSKYGLQLSKSFCKIELSLAISDSVSKHLSYETTYMDNFEKAILEMFPKEDDDDDDTDSDDDSSNDNSESDIEIEIDYSKN